MNKFIYLALLILPTFLYAAEGPTQQVEYDVYGDKYINPRASHWVTSFGFEGMVYETPFAQNFTAVEKQNFPQEKDMYGGRIGLGREFYIGAGLMTTSKIEGYYVGTLFSQKLNAGPEEENEVYANFKQTGNVWGFDASQAISFLFDMKTKNPIMEDWSYLTVEPFIEAGIGWAQAYNRVDYNYNLNPTYESYKGTIRDSLLNARIGIGVNFTSRQGYFLYMKATQNRYDITERKIDETFKVNGGSLQDFPTVTDKDAKIDPVTIYAIGGGYKF